MIKYINTIAIKIGVLLFLALGTVFEKNASVVFAHDSQLMISYDNCIPEYYVNPGNIGDGENETWYRFVRDGKIRHFPNTPNVAEIKYYFDEHIDGDDSGHLWNIEILDSSTRENIKSHIINSILKWNNVHFYCQGPNGTIEKRKLVNIIEGAYNDYHIKIYPYYDLNSDDPPYASTIPNANDSGVLIDTINGIEHRHYSYWNIGFNLYYLDEYSAGYDAGNISYIFERTGAHEFGHVLGLRDVDGCENPNNQLNYHHEELLMGYSHQGIDTRYQNITYKDLVGAAITRGYHTDQDHLWMYDAYSSSPNNFKLICSICNGINYVETLNGYEYVSYKYCNDNHSLSSGNMFAVASYQNYDYYKCKYCRYVASFSNKHAQSYHSTTDINNPTRHITTNYVTGLNYSFYENHSFDSNYYCAICEHQHNHSFTDHHVYYSQIYHTSYCWCGASQLNEHAIDFTTLHNGPGHTMYGDCIDCGVTVVIGDIPFDPPFANNTMVTDNGSYILPNGIKIIVEEDLESYINHTLVFHPYGEVTE